VSSLTEIETGDLGNMTHDLSEIFEDDGHINGEMTIQNAAQNSESETQGKDIVFLDMSQYGIHQSEVKCLRIHCRMFYMSISWIESWIS
jgi:hypothetical protein